ncbi:RNA demethylase ALKBH9B-like isoform X2 [Abrus precatorius]|uniref:RNA demethylase ALKBH9B-like isoform X2 n=1 Tax=Abrus precatorius TaxID=3816 RepID=A0A8B8K499_ABRPR|nr:RNA demethylase ALKBH9B-like isoform X2 [Abrus precatorius]
MAMELSSLKKEDILQLFSDGFCSHCQALLHARITTLRKRKLDETLSPDEGFESSGDDAVDLHVNGNASNSESLTKRHAKQWDSPRNSSQSFDFSPKYFEGCKKSDFELLLNDGIGGDYSVVNGLSEEQKERIRYSQVQSKKDFTFRERVNRRYLNVVQGLELHTGVFNPVEQRKIIECIYRFQWRGKQGKLRDRTYSEPRKWMRGKGRVTIQFGCCYNYAVDKNGNPPGIVRDEEVDPLPPLFKQMIKRMIRSVFVLNGNGANIAKHCIPSVSSKRISITFRKMDENKLPYKFSPDLELVGIKPLFLAPLNKPIKQQDEVGNFGIQQQKAESVETDTF